MVLKRQSPLDENDMIEIIAVIQAARKSFAAGCKVNVSDIIEEAKL
jgi:hypothetical protein